HAAGWRPGTQTELPGAAAEETDLRVGHAGALEQERAAVTLERRELDGAPGDGEIVRIELWTAAAEKGERAAEVVDVGGIEEHLAHTSAPFERVRIPDEGGCVRKLPPV